MEEEVVKFIEDFDTNRLDGFIGGMIAAMIATVIGLLGSGLALILIPIVVLGTLFIFCYRPVKSEVDSTENVC